MLSEKGFVTNVEPERLLISPLTTYPADPFPSVIPGAFMFIIPSQI